MTTVSWNAQPGSSYVDATRNRYLEKYIKLTLHKLGKKKFPLLKSVANLMEHHGIAVFAKFEDSSVTESLRPYHSDTLRYILDM